MLGLRNNNPSQLLLQGTLLSGVIRTGAWAGTPGDRLLDITLAPDQQSLGSPAPASTAAAAAVGGSGSAGADSTAVVIDPRLQDGSDSSGGQEAAPLQQQQAQHPASGVRLAVRLKNGRVSAIQEIRLAAQGCVYTRAVPRNLGDLFVLAYALHQAPDFLPISDAGAG